MITTYNYERFVGDAVRSALAQTHGAVEVVVVDDGSTDATAERVGAFPGVRLIRKPNGGQGSAFNAGWRATSGDIVIFLDADDQLDPSAARLVAAAMAGRVSKVQFCLRIVDEVGGPSGQVLPRHARIDASRFRHRTERAGSYPTPPTSGNAFARWYLQRIMPLPEEDFRYDAEGLPVLLAPFFGDVVHLDEVLGAYRVHGGNHIGGHGDVRLLREQLDRGRRKAAIAERVLDDVLGIRWDHRRLLRRNPFYLGRLANLRALAPHDALVAGWHPLALTCRLATARLLDPFESPAVRLRGAAGALAGVGTRRRRSAPPRSAPATVPSAADVSGR